MKNILFLIVSLIVFQLQSQVIVIAGSAVQTWPGDTDPVPNYTLQNNGDGTHFLMGLDLLDGQVRFREEQDWDVSYGGTAFPEGSISDNNIPVEEGIYDIYLDLNSNTYSFISYPKVSFHTFYSSIDNSFELTTDDNEVFFHPILQFSDGMGWFIMNTHPAIMEPEEFGGDNFPSGNLVNFDQPLIIEAGFYEVTFNLTEQTFSFDVPEIGIIGAAVVAPSIDDNATPEVLMSSINGAIYTLNNVELQPGELKFRQNQNWDTNWGGNTFPSGDSVLNSSDYIIVDEAGVYDVTFDRENQSYMFVTLSTNDNEFYGLKVYPNPSQGNWNVHTGKADVNMISIFSISGKLIKEMNVSHQKEIEINTAQIEAGMYMMKLSTASGNIKTLKLIKQ